MCVPARGPGFFTWQRASRTFGCTAATAPSAVDVYKRQHHDRKNTEDGYIDTYSMVYTNLIAVITHELQLEKERRSNLEIEVADLRSELESMRDNISGDTN